MFFSQKTVIVALLLTFVAMPVSAEPAPHLGNLIDDALLDPARQLWQALVSVFESLDSEATEVAPSARTEKALGWIDPAGAQGDSASPEFSAEHEDGGLVDFHGWVDPAGASGEGDGS